MRPRLANALANAFEWDRKPIPLKYAHGFVMADGSGMAATAAPVKRSLFKNKAALARTLSNVEAMSKAGTDHIAGVELFSRSKDIFEQAIREKELENDRKLKSSQRIEHERSLQGHPAGKRRRISRDDEESKSIEEFDSPTGVAGPSSASPSDSPRRKKAHSPKEAVNLTMERVENWTRDAASLESGKTTSRRNKSSKSPVKRSEPTNVIDLEDSDKESSVEFVRIQQPVALLGNTSTNHDEPDLEEEEFPELVAAARKRALMEQGIDMEARVRARLAQLRGESPKSSTASPGPRPDMRSPLQDPPPDPVLQILITARLGDTVPLICRRKLSQRFKDLRLAWCDRQLIDGQPLTAAMRDAVFLTWRGHRLFDTSTGRALNLEVDKQGEIVTNGDGFDEGRIHLEAWTQETWNEQERIIQEERRKAVHGLAQDDQEESEPEPEVEVQRKYKLILKAKDYKEVKLSCSADTLIEKLAQRYRTMAEVDEDKNVSLRFEGEELAPTSTVKGADFDIDERCQVEVHVS